MTGIVMMSRTVSKIDGTSGWEWHIVTDPLGYVDRDIRPVSRREAMDFIRGNGLVEALETPYGTVWDTPDRSFQRRFKGCLSPTGDREADKAVRRRWMRIWGD